MLAINTSRTRALQGRAPRGRVRVVPIHPQIVGAAHSFGGRPGFQEVFSDVIRPAEFTGTPTPGVDTVTGARTLAFTASQYMIIKNLPWYGTGDLSISHRCVAMALADAYGGFFAMRDPSTNAYLTLQRNASAAQVITYVSNTYATGAPSFSTHTSWITYTSTREGTNARIYRDKTWIGSGTSLTPQTGNTAAELMINSERGGFAENTQTWVDTIVFKGDAKNLAAAGFFSDSHQRWRMYEEYGQRKYFIVPPVAAGAVGRGLTHSQRGHRVSLVA